MKLFFVGFMGCGKTTWSRKLAVHLGYEFIDLDQVLEKKIGMPSGYWSHRY
jgi:shikimate kinase